MKELEWNNLSDQLPDVYPGAGKFMENSGWLRVEYTDGSKGYASYWWNKNWIDDKLVVTNKIISKWKAILDVPKRLFPLIQKRVTKKSQGKLIESIARQLKMV